MNEMIIEMPKETYIYNYPASFAEYTRRHLMALTRYGSIQNPNQDDYMRFILNFIGIPRKVAKKIQRINAAQMAEMEALGKNTDGFTPGIFHFEVVEDNVILMPELAYQAKPYQNLKSLMRRIGIFYGPRYKLNNMNLEQIGFADTFSNAYSQDQSAKDLNLFFGVLYQPFSLPFHKRLIEIYAFAAKFVPSLSKQAALRNYRGIQEAYKELHPSVFKGGKVSKTAKFGWPGTIRKLAKTGIHGNESHCKRVKYPDAMITFDLNNIEIEEGNDEIKKQARK